MNNSTIAWKTRVRPSAVSLRSAVLDDFMVKMFHGFSKPLNKFIRDMVYGMQATGDTIITDIACAVAPEDNHRNVENRLSRNLQTEGLHVKIWDAIQADAVRFIAHRAHAPEVQRGAGVLPLRAGRGNQAGIRALRKLGDESRGQEEG